MLEHLKLQLSNNTFFAIFTTLNFESHLKLLEMLKKNVSKQQVNDFVIENYHSRLLSENIKIIDIFKKLLQYLINELFKEKKKDKILIKNLNIYFCKFYFYSKNEKNKKNFSFILNFDLEIEFSKKNDKNSINENLKVIHEFSRFFIKIFENEQKKIEKRLIIKVAKNIVLDNECEIEKNNKKKANMYIYDFFEKCQLSEKNQELIQKNTLLNITNFVEQMFIIIELQKNNDNEILNLFKNLKKKKG